MLANSSSCIDLIFTDQPSLIVDCGIHPSLHPNCHHQIVYCKLDLKIVYPPPYQRHVWDFKRANIDSIRKAIKMIDWHFMLLNKNVHEQVSTFNTTLINIFSNYIPNKYITVDDKDPHGWQKLLKIKLIWKSPYQDQKISLDYKIEQLRSRRWFLSERKNIVISQRKLMTLTLVLRPTGQF